MTCDDCRAIEEDTGQTPLCMSGGKCDKPMLATENVDAWNAYWMVWDQIGTYHKATDEKQLHIYLRAEAVAAAIGLLDVSDPAAAYSGVMLIHRTRYGGI